MNEETDEQIRNVESSALLSLSRSLCPGVFDGTAFEECWNKPQFPIAHERALTPFLGLFAEWKAGMISSAPARAHPSLKMRKAHTCIPPPLYVCVVRTSMCVCGRGRERGFSRDVNIFFKIAHWYKRIGESGFLFSVSWFFFLFHLINRIEGDAVVRWVYEFAAFANIVK